VSRRLCLFTLCCIAFCSGCYSNALAGENEETPVKKKAVRATYLDEIVEVSADSVHSALMDTPSTISILTSEDMNNSGQREISGVINSIPGVMDDGSGSTYFSFRGTRSTSSEGAAVFIDGKPLNIGRFDYSMIDDIPVDVVERIEVAKSPAATRYGAVAARGVINIITKSGKDAEKALQAGASLDAGSWNSYKGFARVFGKIGRWDYGTQFARDQAEGYRHIDSERTMLEHQIGVEITEGIRLDWNLGWNESFSKNAPKLKYWSLDDRRQNNPWDSEQKNGYRIRPNETDRSLITTGLAFNAAVNKWIFNSQFDYGRYGDDYASLQYFNNPGNGTKQRGQGVYTEDREEDKVNLKVSASREFAIGTKLISILSAGYDYAYMGWGQKRDYPYASSLSASTALEIQRNTIDFTRAIHGLYVNNTLKYGKFGLYLGLRQDRVAYDYSTAEPVKQDKWFDELSWDIAPSFSPTPNSNCYFRAGRSFWYPNAFYLQYAVRYNDPENQPEDLMPEKYLNYEAGFKQRVNRHVNYSVALYRMEIDNKYLAFYNTEGAFGGYKHIGRSIHQGVELEVDGNPLQWFGYRAGFTYLDAEWDKAKARVTVWGKTPNLDMVQYVDLSGMKVSSVPNYQYSVSLLFNPTRRLHATINIHGYGEQYIDALDRYKDDSVHLADLKVRFELSGSMELHFLSSNLFDKKYENIFNTAGARTGNGLPDHDFYPKAGRYVQAGIKVRF
jgi:iron complex outermembrane recepter protein